jgi:hypothetical protein
MFGDDNQQPTGKNFTACFMVVSYLAYFSTYKMEATCFSETSADFHATALCYIQEEITIIRFVKFWTEVNHNYAHMFYTYFPYDNYKHGNFESIWMHIWQNQGTVITQLVYRLGYVLDDRGVGVRVPVWSRFFSSPRRSDRLWSPASLLSSGYRGRFLRR